MEKEKTLTSNLKKVSQGIESNRKNIQGNTNIIHNINELKSNFQQIQGLIKGQTSSIDGMRVFSKEQTTQASKNIEIKKMFSSMIEKIKLEMTQYLTIIQEYFVTSYKQLSEESKQSNWHKILKDLEKSLTIIQEQSNTVEQMFEGIQRVNVGKQQVLMQLLKLLVYQKNILWRDLNAPYDDYIHGQVKQVINEIKQNEEKYGYIPSKLKFELPKFDIKLAENSMIELFKIHMKDSQQLVEGLKNYSKLKGEEQVIEDISKNQHIVKGLRDRIQKLTVNYDSLMSKYRNLQISKGKLSNAEQKSLSEKVEDLEILVQKKQQQFLETKQLNQKSEQTIQGLRDKIKQLEEQLSKFQKYQMPKIKQLENNQKNILEEFIKVRRDLQTYTNIINVEREEKLKFIDDLKSQKKRVEDLVFILGRERRKTKELKGEINRKEQIIMELVDVKLPS